MSLSQPGGHRREEALLHGGVAARKRPDNERPLAGTRAHEALPFEVPVGLKHRVGIDRQLGDHLLGRRQLVSWLEDAELQCLADLLDQLQVGGDT